MSVGLISSPRRRDGDNKPHPRPQTMFSRFGLGLLRPHPNLDGHQTPTGNTPRTTRTARTSTTTQYTISSPTPLVPKAAPSSQVATALVTQQNHGPESSTLTIDSFASSNKSRHSVMTEAQLEAAQYHRRSSATSRTTTPESPVELVTLASPTFPTSISTVVDDEDTVLHDASPSKVIKRDTSLLSKLSLTKLPRRKRTTSKLKAAAAAGNTPDTSPPSMSRRNRPSTPRGGSVRGSVFGLSLTPRKRNKSLRFKTSLPSIRKAFEVDHSVPVPPLPAELGGRLEPLNPAPIPLEVSLGPSLGRVLAQAQLSPISNSPSRGSSSNPLGPPPPSKSITPLSGTGESSDGGQQWINKVPAEVGLDLGFTPSPQSARVLQRSKEPTVSVHRRHHSEDVSSSSSRRRGTFLDAETLSRIPNMESFESFMDDGRESLKSVKSDGFDLDYLERLLTHEHEQISHTAQKPTIAVTGVQRSRSPPDAPVSPVAMESPANPESILLARSSSSHRRMSGMSGEGWADYAGVIDSPAPRLSGVHEIDNFDSNWSLAEISTGVNNTADNSGVPNPNESSTAPFRPVVLKDSSLDNVESWGELGSNVHLPDVHQGSVESDRRNGYETALTSPLLSVDTHGPTSPLEAYLRTPASFYHDNVEVEDNQPLVQGQSSEAGDFVPVDDDRINAAEAANKSLRSLWCSDSTESLCDPYLSSPTVGRDRRLSTIIETSHSGSGRSDPFHLTASTSTRCSDADNSLGLSKLLHNDNEDSWAPRGVTPLQDSANASFLYSRPAVTAHRRHCSDPSGIPPMRWQSELNDASAMIESLENAKRDADHRTRLREVELEDKATLIKEKEAETTLVKRELGALHAVVAAHDSSGTTARLTNKIKEQEDELVAVRKELNGANAKLAQARDNHSTTKFELEELKFRFMNEDRISKQIVEKQEAQRKRNSLLQQELIAAVESENLLSKAVPELENEVQSRGKQIVELVEALKEAAAAKQEALEVADKFEKLFVTEREALRTQRTHWGDWKEHRHNLEVDNHDLREMAMDNRDTISKLENKICRYEQVDIPSLEESIETFKEMLEAATSEDPDLSIASVESTTTLVNQQYQITKLNRQVEDRTAELDDLTAKFARHARECNKERSGLRDDLREARDTTKQLKASLQQALDEKENHRERAADHFSRGQSYMEQIDALHLEKARIEDENAGLRRTIANGNVESSKLETQVKSLARDRDILNTALESKQFELELTRRTVVSGTPRGGQVRGQTAGNKTPTSQLLSKISPLTGKRLRSRRSPEAAGGADGVDENVPPTLSDDVLDTPVRHQRKWTGTPCGGGSSTALATPSRNRTGNSAIPRLTTSSSLRSPAGLGSNNTLCESVRQNRTTRGDGSQRSELAPTKRVRVGLAGDGGETIFKPSNDLGRTPSRTAGGTTGTVGLHATPTRPKSALAGAATPKIDMSAPVPLTKRPTSAASVHSSSLSQVSAAGSQSHIPVLVRPPTPGGGACTRHRSMRGLPSAVSAGAV